MSMIRTHKRDNPFVQLDKDFIGGDKLSLKATGLLTYILSKPDNWQIYMKDIQNQFKDGEGSITSGMNELIKAGYIYRWRERDEKGRLRGYVYEVYERPEFNTRTNEKEVFKSSETTDNKATEPKRNYPELDKPETDKPELENSVFSNNELNNNELSNNELNNNQSLEAKIQKLDISLEIKKQLIRNQKRLIDDNISISDIVDVYKAYTNRVSNSEFALILGNVLTGTKEKIQSIKHLLMHSVINHMKQNAAPEPVKKVSNEIVPDWFNERKRGY